MLAEHPLTAFSRHTGEQEAVLIFSPLPLNPRTCDDVDIAVRATRAVFRMMGMNTLLVVPGSEDGVVEETTHGHAGRGATITVRNRGSRLHVVMAVSEGARLTATGKPFGTLTRVFVARPLGSRPLLADLGEAGLNSSVTALLPNYGILTGIGGDRARGTDGDLALPEQPSDKELLTLNGYHGVVVTPDDRPRVVRRLGSLMKISELTLQPLPTAAGIQNRDLNDDHLIHTKLSDRICGSKTPSFEAARQADEHVTLTQVPKNLGREISTYARAVMDASTLPGIGHQITYTALNEVSDGLAGPGLVIESGNSGFSINTNSPNLN